MWVDGKAATTSFPEEVRAFRQQNQVFEDVIAYVAYAFSTTAADPVLIGRSVSSDSQYFRLPRHPRTAGENPFARRWKAGRSAGDGNELPILAAGVCRGSQDPRKVFLLDGSPNHPRRHNASPLQRFWQVLLASRQSRQIPPPLRGGATVIGRLKPAVSLRTAAADLDTIAHHLQLSNPDGTIPKKIRISASAPARHINWGLQEITLRSPLGCPSIASYRLQQRRQSFAGACQHPRA